MTKTGSLARQNDKAIVSVRDTGIGIAAEHLPHIFERFYRVNGASDDDGSGLGLTICHEIVKLHGGRITVESKEGEGNIFRVAIPISLSARRSASGKS